MCYVTSEVHELCRGAKILQDAGGGCLIRRRWLDARWLCGEVEPGHCIISGVGRFASPVLRNNSRATIGL